MEDKKFQFSVVDTESKYVFDDEESVYGNNMVIWGSNNDMPKTYQYCYNNSATLKSVIDGYVKYILGDDVVSNKEYVNPEGMTMKSLILQLAIDYMNYGGFAIQVIYSKLGTITGLYPLNFAKCRTNEKRNKIWYFKKGCTKYSTKGEEFDAFDKSRFDVKKPTQVLYFKGETTKSVYPKPMWYAAITDVLTDIEAGKYSLNTITNGFLAKYILSFPNSGNLTDEQKDSIEQGIKNKFCGSEQDSNFMLYFANGEEKMDISKIETSDDVSERYIAIKNNCRDNIFVSMRCNPMLFGLNVNTGFNTDEFSNVFKLFQKTQIQPIQDMFTDVFKRLDCNVEIKPFSITFDESTDKNNDTINN